MSQSNVQIHFKLHDFRCRSKRCFCCIEVNSNRCISPRRELFQFFAPQLQKMCCCIEVDLTTCFWPRREHLFLKNMHFVHGPPSRPLGTTTTTTTTTTTATTTPTVLRMLRSAHRILRRRTSAGPGPTSVRAGQGHPVQHRRQQIERLKQIERPRRRERSGEGADRGRRGKQGAMFMMLISASY